MDNTVSRRWWRRNAIALVALAVVIVAGVFAVDRIEFGYVRNTPVAVEEGGTYSLAGWTLGPVTVESLDPDAVGAPAGTDPVAVTMHVEPAAGEFDCRAPKIVEPATDRTWRTENLPDWERDEDQLSFCSSEVFAPYDVVNTVLLLDGLPGHLTVTVPVTGDGQILDLEFAVSR